MKLLDKMRRKCIATLKAEIKEYEELYKETYDMYRLGGRLLHMAHAHGDVSQ